MALRSFLLHWVTMHFVDSMVGEHGVESGYQMMRQWLEEAQVMPDAFFVSNDPIAIGAMKALNEAQSRYRTKFR